MNFLIHQKNFLIKFHTRERTGLSINFKINKKYHNSTNIDEYYNYNLHISNEVNETPPHSAIVKH